MKYILICLVFLNISFASNLKEISDFAKNICGEIKIAGEQEGYKLDLKGKFNPKLLSKIGIKTEASGQYTEHKRKYNNLLLKDIPKELRDIRRCKIYVLDKFNLQSKNQSNVIPQKTNFACEKKIIAIKQYTYGAINKNYYDLMKNAINHNNSKVLNEMIKDGRIIQLKKKTKACLIQDDFNWYRAKVKINDFNDYDYWIDDRKIIQLD